MSRVAFRLAQALQAGWLTPPALRCALLKMVGVSMHPTASVGRGVTFTGPRLVLGADTRVGHESFIWSDVPVVLEEGVWLAPRVEVVGVSHRIGGPERRSGEVVTRQITFGRGAWIGQGAKIAADVAPGCVIRLGAVVTRPTEPHGVYEGNPAVRVRELRPCRPNEGGAVAASPAPAPAPSAPPSPAPPALGGASPHPATAHALTRSAS